MKLELFDKGGRLVTATDDVPDDVVAATRLAYDWMMANGVVQLNGLWTGPILSRAGEGGWREEE